MEKKETILNNQSESEHLLAIGSVPLPYGLPDGYFNTVSEQVLNRLGKDNLLVNQNKTPQYSVPEGYFNNFSDSVLQSIKLEHNQGDSFKDAVESTPFLNSISKANVYQVPEGYFDTLISSNQQKPVAKVIKLNSIRLWMKVGMAASFAGIILLAVTLFSTKEKNAINYMAYKNTDIKGNVTKISDDELVKYLNNDYLATTADMVITDDGGDEPDINQKVETIPDEDLNQYLQDAATTPVIKKGI